MELKINEIAIPQPITFNYQDLKKELTAKVEEYKTIAYTEEQIAYAKKDRANLNALKKALNDERIKQEREYMKPFEGFKAQIKELCSIIDAGSSTIDQQIKAIEEEQKKAKADAIKQIWENRGADEWMIRNEDKWLNASVSLKTIETAIAEHLLKIQKDLDTLDGLSIGFEGMRCYQHTLDINQAIAEEAKAKKQAEDKARWEAEHSQLTIEEPKEEQKPIEEAILSNIEEPARKWIGFEALLSVEEAKMLGEYFKTKNIKYRKPQNKE